MHPTRMLTSRHVRLFKDWKGPSALQRRLWRQMIKLNFLLLKKKEKDTCDRFFSNTQILLSLVLYARLKLDKRFACDEHSLFFRDPKRRTTVSHDCILRNGWVVSVVVSTTWVVRRATAMCQPWERQPWMKVPRIDLSAPPYIRNMINRECAYTDLRWHFNHSDPYLFIFPVVSILINLCALIMRAR